MKNNNLLERLLQFSIDVLKFLKTLSNTPENNIIKNQLSKSATSSGANYEESQGAASRADFLNKVRISLKEMRESNYWLKIIKRTETGDKTQIDKILRESEELKRILGSIASKTSVVHPKEKVKSKK